MRLTHLIYRIAKPFGGLQLARHLSRKHPRILMYHRLNPKGLNGGLSVDIFRAQMREIRNAFNPMSLSDLMQAHDRGEELENAVVVTFDDGYHDFLEYAYPILLEERIPTTLFVTTGFTSGDLWLWPDQLRYALEHSRATSVALPAMNDQLNLQASRLDAWHRVADYCLTLTNHEKLHFMQDLFVRLDVNIPDKPPAQYTPLSWGDIRQMVDSGLEIGSHSISHPILTKLDDDELLAELRKSRLEIETQLGVTPKAFCYPNGQRIDFDSRIQEAVRQAGYEYALAAYPDKRPLGDRWAINRYAVGASRDLFEKTLYGLSYLGMDYSGKNTDLP